MGAVSYCVFDTINEPHVYVDDLTDSKCSQEYDTIFLFPFSSVRDFLESGVKKMLHIFPLTSKTLKLVPAANPQLKMQYTAPQVCELAKSVSVAISSVELDRMADEWMDYQLDECGGDTTDVGGFWCSSSTHDAFPTLTKLMRIVLSIPHSNASSERVFSMVKKIVTDQRSLLAPDTVNSLLRIKINTDKCCLDTKFDTRTLRKLKRAAMEYNAKHPTSTSTPSTSTANLQE